MIINKDCLVALKDIPSNSIEAVITDPPYELGFMGKSWDNTGVAYRVDLWRDVLRILKPGGHLLSFGGSRTYHRMASAIEDAGFEIRDQIMWVYGSGFPKSLNIGKAVDKLQGNEREVVGVSEGKGYSSQQEKNKVEGFRPYKKGLPYEHADRTLTKGTSEWEGWGTALKPSHEPIVLARKPLSEKTVVANILKWGVGGINIDACRIKYIGKTDPRSFGGKWKTDKAANNIYEGGYAGKDQEVSSLGRFPANFIHDGSQEVMELFPNTKAGVAVRHNSGGNTFGSNIPKPPMNDIGYAASGSAARFFYCAKASKGERNKGCWGLDIHGSNYCEEYRPKATESRDKGQDTPYAGVNRSGGVRNNHPTVKPLLLMKYLVKLVSREGQTVLDPFMGSGTTGIACKELNRNFIGIEMNKDYFKIAEKRISNTESSLL